MKYYEHLEGLKHYGKDAAEFKVGDKVKHTQYGTIGKVFEIDPAGNIGVQWDNGQAYYGKTAKPLSLIIAADSAAQDRGDYYTNSEALLRMALGNLRNASRVVRQATSNIFNAMVKVKDERTKGFLKGIYQSWARCYKELEDVIHEAEMIAIPTAYGIPHKEKIPPEERDLLKEFFE